MRREAYAAYSPADHIRVQLGISERECTPTDDTPGISVRFTITAPRLNRTNAQALKIKALDAIARQHVFMAIDMRECVDVSRDGFSVFASIGYKCRQAGGELTIENPSDDLVTLFRAASIDKLFTIYPFVGEAAA